MGILSVGLASVLALIPAGKSQAKRAAIEDGRGALGSSALEDCVNRGLLRKSLWRNPVTFAVATSGTVVWDPLFLPLTGTTARFPSGLTPITLSTTGTTVSACDDVARAQDDLVFVVPENDEIAPASPRFSDGKRLAEGHFSWLATLVPADASPTPEYFRLSVVEFHKRPFDGTPGEASQSFAIPNTNWAGTSVELVGLALTKDEFSRFFKTGCVVLVSDGSTNYRWLRVLMASPTESSDGASVTSIDLTFDQDPLFTPSVLCAYAGAVGVAEKIVRLEGDSPWVTP